jgi:hypothetical protein
MRIAQRSWSLFLTITIDGDGSLSNTNFRRLSKGWSNVKRWLRRNGYKVSDTTWVRERGEHGTRRLHQHVLIAGETYISVRRLRNALRRNGLGRWCHVSRIKTQRQARRYVAKYLGKTLDRSAWPRYARRCQTSIPRSRAEPGRFLFEKRRRFVRARQADNDRMARALVRDEMECERIIAADHDWPQLPLSLTKKEKLSHDQALNQAFSTWQPGETGCERSNAGIGPPGAQSLRQNVGKFGSAC